MMLAEDGQFRTTVISCGDKLPFFFWAFVTALLQATRQVRDSWTVFCKSGLKYRYTLTGFTLVRCGCRKPQRSGSQIRTDVYTLDVLERAGLLKADLGGP